MNNQQPNNAEIYLENILENQDNKLTETNNTLEMILDNQNEGQQENSRLMENQLEMQGIINENISSNGENLAKAVKDLKPAMTAAGFIQSFMEAIRGDKGEKGDNGITPQKGKDYFTPNEIKEIVQEIQTRIKVPQKGKDYFTDAEIKSMIEIIISRIPKPKNGKDGKDGKDGRDGEDGVDGLDAVVDYPKIIKEVSKKIPKNKEKSLTAETVLKLIKGKLLYSDLKNAPQYLGGAGYLKDVSDVNIQNPEVGESLVWDGQAWKNDTVGGGSSSVSSVNTKTGNVILTTDDIDDSSGRRYVTDTEKSGWNEKADLVSGKVPASQLPSYVDDVLEFLNFTAFPETGESGKIYISIDNNKTYRWGGSSYVEISGGVTLGETSSTAYRGDRGKTAYDHSQASGNPHSTTKADVGLGNVDNTSDVNKPVSTATQAALDGKASSSHTHTNDHTHTNKSVLDATQESYTTAEKTKLAGITAGAEVNVQADWNQTDTAADDYIKNKPSISGAAKDYLTISNNASDGADYTCSGTNHTTTFQAAIDAAAAAGKALYIMPSSNHYLVTGAILKTNSEIYGGGIGRTILESNSSQDLACLSTTKSGTSKTVYSNIKLHDFSVFSNHGHGIFINNTDGVEVYRVEEKSLQTTYFREGIVAQHCKNVHFYQNTLRDLSGNGIQINGCDFFSVRFNTVDGGENADDLIDIDKDFLDTKTIQSNHGVVFGNTIKNGNRGNGIRVAASNFVEVFGNEISGMTVQAAAGIMVNSYNNTEGSNGCDTINVHGNSISDCVGAGISVVQNYIGSTAQKVENVKISDNNISSCGSVSNTGVSAGIILNSPDVFCMGNSLDACGMKADGFSGAIVIYRESGNIVVDNRISDSPIGVRSWNGSGTVVYSNLRVYHNRITGATYPLVGDGCDSSCVFSGEPVLGGDSSTNNAITRFYGTTGKIIQSSNNIIEDNGQTKITMSGDTNDWTEGGGGLYINNTANQNAGFNLFSKHTAPRMFARMVMYSPYVTTISGAQTINNTTTSITVTSTAGFPDSGLLVVSDSTSDTENSNKIYIRYASKTANTFEGVAGTFYRPTRIASIRTGGKVYYVNETSSCEQLLLENWSKHGGAVEMKLRGNNPDIEFVGVGGFDSSKGEGKFEIDIPVADGINPSDVDVFRINSRNDANNSYETVVIVTRSGATGRGMIGVGFRNKKDPVEIGAHLHIKNDSSFGDTNAHTLVGEIVQGASGQTADLAQWRNHTGDVLAKVDAVGNFVANNLSTFTPVDYNLKVWAYDPIMAYSSEALTTAGSLYGVRIIIPSPMTISKLHVYVDTAGSGLTAGQCLAGIYQGGNLKGTTGDMSGVWNTVGHKAMSLTASASLVAGYADVVFFGRGTTLPAFTRAAGSAIVHLGLTGENLRFFTANTGLTTSLPNTLGTKSPASRSYWVGIS